jgi:hypothetical protein
VAENGLMDAGKRIRKMGKKKSIVNSVPDYRQEDGNDVSICSILTDHRTVNPDKKKVPTDLFRSGNGSNSNIVRAETTGDSRVENSNSDAKTVNKTSDATTGKKTNDAKTRNRTSVANATACTSGWGRCLTGGEDKN